MTTADIRLAKMRCATRTYWTKVLYAGPRNLRKCLREFSLADEIISKTTANVERTKNMKQIVSFQMISALALLALTAGCATTQSSTQNKESMLVASGFKVITPKTAVQQQKLQALPPGKVAMIQKRGKTYYIFPDAAHNQAYVGGPKEYQAYQQLRAQRQLAQENLQTAEMYQDAAMGVGYMGWLGSWLGTNGLWGWGRTGRWRWAVLNHLTPLGLPSAVKSTRRVESM